MRSFLLSVIRAALPEEETQYRGLLSVLVLCPAVTGVCGDCALLGVGKRLPLGLKAGNAIYAFMHDHS